MSSLRVLVTGASGLVGKHLVERLQNSSLDELVGIDINPPQNNSYPFYKLDITSPDLADVISQYKTDTLVHLACVQITSRDKDLQHKTNILGTENVINAAKKLRIKRLVFASTCAVHGVSKKRLEHFYTEESPFDETDDLPYAQHKIWAEKALQAFQKETGIPVCILRPCTILGPNTNNVISRSISDVNPLPTIIGYNPRRQFVHEDDVAKAFYQAIIQQVQGVFHVSSDDAVPQSELYELVKTKKVEIPYLIARLALRYQYKKGKLETPLEMMKYIMYEFLTDNSKMKRELCQPRYNTRETFLSFIQARGIAA